MNSIKKLLNSTCQHKDHPAVSQLGSPPQHHPTSTTGHEYHKKSTHGSEVVFEWPIKEFCDQCTANFWPLATFLFLTQFVNNLCKLDNPLASIGVKPVLYDLSVLRPNLHFIPLVVCLSVPDVPAPYALSRNSNLITIPSTSSAGLPNLVLLKSSNSFPTTMFALAVPILKTQPSDANYSSTIGTPRCACMHSNQTPTSLHLRWALTDHSLGRTYPWVISL